MPFKDARSPASLLGAVLGRLVNAHAHATDAADRDRLLRQIRLVSAKLAQHLEHDQVQVDPRVNATIKPDDNGGD